MFTWLITESLSVGQALKRCHTDMAIFFRILTYWGRLRHICVMKLTTIGSDNGLSPGRRQAIIWNNAGISLNGPLGTNFSEVLTEIYAFSFKKMHLKMSSGKWRPFCLGLNVLAHRPQEKSSCFSGHHSQRTTLHISANTRCIDVIWTPQSKGTLH